MRASTVAKRECRMAKNVLFDSDSLYDHSPVFEIPTGGEVTAVALGLVGDEDYVHFEMVYAPGIKPDSCDCPPVEYQPPVVTNKAILQFDGKPVVLTPDNPVAVLNAPQGQPMRAVRHINDDNDKAMFRLTISDTKTSCVNEHLLGLNESYQVEE